MSSTPNPAPRKSTGDQPERRRNPRLRELVEEMLVSIRIASNKDLWSAEELERYKADMARIMEAVRIHAIESKNAETSNKQ